MFKPDWPTILSSNFGNSVATNQFFLSPPILATLLPQLFFFFFLLLQFSAIATVIPINFFALLFPYNFSNSTILFFLSNFWQLHCHNFFFLLQFLTTSLPQINFFSHFFSPISATPLPQIYIFFSLLQF